MDGPICPACGCVVVDSDCGCLPCVEYGCGGHYGMDGVCDCCGLKHVTTTVTMPGTLNQVTFKLGIDDTPEEGRKDDSGKLDWSLFPWKGAEAIVRVLMFGARKYAPNNWKKVPDAKRRYFNATIRHMTAWIEGEENDPETGLPHLAHAGCCVLFLLAMTPDKTDSAERQKTEDR